jgi:pyridoxamine 5'-phosphate oxidase family protein
MGIFTESEVEYMGEHPLGVLATVAKNGDPHAVPVNYMYNPEFESIDIVGSRLEATLKYKNIVRFGRASFLIYDVFSLTPYQTRFLHIRGAAKVLTRKATDPIPMLPGAAQMPPEILALRARSISLEMIRIYVEKIVAAAVGDDPTEVLSRTYGPDHELVETHRNGGFNPSSRRAMRSLGCRGITIITWIAEYYIHGMQKC